MLVFAQPFVIGDAFIYNYPQNNTINSKGDNMPVEAVKEQQAKRLKAASMRI